LAHPNIARCYASGTAPDADGRNFSYLVLEHLAGGSLARLSGRPVPLPQALDYVGQAATALSYVHAQGFLHRDLKPANLLLTADRRTLKLIDFGTVRALADETRDITLVGTAAYAAPEHYALPTSDGPPELTPAADVYALAKTFYALLGGVSPREFRQRPLTHWPQNVASEPWAGAALFALARATRNQPEQRYQSVTEFYDALCAACDQTIVAARERSGTTARVVIELDGAQQPRGFQPFNLRRGVIAVVTASALLLGLPLAWRSWRPAAKLPPAPAAAANTPAKPKPKTPPPRRKKSLRKR
jgi:serine/threonine-protein kinase